MDASHLRGGKKDEFRARFGKEGFDLLRVLQIELRMGAGDEVCEAFGLKAPNECGADEAAVAGDVYPRCDLHCSRGNRGYPVAKLSRPITV